MSYHNSNIGFDSHRTTNYTGKGKGGKKSTKDTNYYGRNYGYGYGDDDYYDNYYGGSAGSNFSWGSFGGFGSLSEDDDKDLVIKSHPSYFTPKGSDISLRIGWNSDTKSNRDLIKEMARFFYYKMLEEKDYFDEKYDDLSTLEEKDIEMIATKQGFYGGLWDKFIPGYSPLEKALFVFSELERNTGNKKKDKFTPQDLDRVVDTINVDAAAYADPIYNELLDEDVYGKKGNKMRILNRLALVKNFGSEFKIEKEMTERVVPNSHLTANRMLTDFSQINNVELYQRLIPNFNVKLLTKDLVVRVPVDRTEHKQKIIILLDYSGSMNEESKQEWVIAVLIDRLKYAIKEEAEIFFSYFLSNTSYLKFTHIHNRETALAFWRTFSTRPSGGSTELGDMVQFIGNEIMVNKKLCNLNIDLSEDKPEILAINDGNDSVNTDEFTYKTNAISLRQSNNELKDLCVKNKGKYIIIYDDHIESYSKGDKEIHKY